LRRPHPTPDQKTASTRVEGLAACNSQDLSSGETKLDEAAEMDREGDNAKPVVKTRAAIDPSKGTTDPGEKPHRRPQPGLSRAAKTLTDGSDPVFSLHLDGLLSSVE
jgi:hypothetical protein